MALTVILIGVSYIRLRRIYCILNGQHHRSVPLGVYHDASVIKAMCS